MQLKKHRFFVGHNSIVLKCTLLGLTAQSSVNLLFLVMILRGCLFLRPLYGFMFHIYIPYGRKFWRGIYFGGLAVLRAIRQYFIRQKLHSMMSSLLQNHSLCTRPTARRASLIVGIEFTFESCVRGHCFSKEFCTPKERVGLSVNARKVVQMACTRSL